MSATRRYAVDSKVLVVDSESQRYATVLRHGYDAQGIYTEVRYFDNGESERVHRSMLRPVADAPCGLQHR